MHTRRRVRVCCLTLLFTACARQPEPPPPNVSTTPAQGKYVPGDYAETIRPGGQTRRYRLHVPIAYRAGSAMALVLNLHGLNESAAMQERLSAMSGKADQAGFIVTYPEGLGTPQNWKIGPNDAGVEDQNFLLALIRYLETQLTVDPTRIDVTGISNGAEMTERMGCEHADVIAAIAPVSGGYFRAERCNPPRPVPVVAFHGTADTLLPYDGRPPFMISVKDWAAQWAARNDCAPSKKVTYQHGDVSGITWSDCKQNADVTLYTVDDGGHAWPGSNAPPVLGKVTNDINATDTIWEFFANHPKP